MARALAALPDPAERFRNKLNKNDEEVFAEIAVVDGDGEFGDIGKHISKGKILTKISEWEQIAKTQEERKKIRAAKRLAGLKKNTKTATDKPDGDGKKRKLLIFLNSRNQDARVDC